MAQEAFLASQFLVAFAMLLLAGYLLWLNFAGTIHRIFALFLGARATTIILNQMVRLDPANAPFWFGVRGYFFIALPFILFDFWVVYQWRLRTPTRRIARVASVAILMLIEALYLFDHSLLYTRVGAGYTSGPFGVLETAPMTIFAALGVWFSFGSRNAAVGVQRRFQFLVGLGFAVAAITESVILWRAAIVNGFDTLWAPAGQPTLSEILTDGTGLAALPGGLLAVLVLVRTAVERNQPRLRNLVIATTGFCLVVPVVARALDPSASGGFFLLALGFARLAMPIIIGVAIIRYASSGIDPWAFHSTLNVAIRRGTLSTIFIAAYLAFGDVLSEILPETPLLQSFSSLWAQVIGAACAGLLLLAIHPLRRASTKISNSMVPVPASPKDLSLAEREALYSDQAEIAWSDGLLSRKERILLDQLRARLRLSPEVASRLEGQAVAGRKSLSKDQTESIYSTPPG